jgi:2-C-methyl-D-erythritol 4-phosphate cytidylyltransferase/2-C-methyl-D-erythritol 2,4-cyclodiphosphate synthase
MDAGVVAIILGGGSGERLGSAEPKAFVELAPDASLLRWAYREALDAPTVGRVIVVVPSGYEERTRQSFPNATVVAGGSTRQASVMAALVAMEADVSDDGVVLCHDAARPFASSALFDSVALAIGDADGVLPVVPISDTVKRVAEGRVVETVRRDELALAQTPQAFPFGVLRKAHARAAEQGLDFTDDAALVEWAGGIVRTVPGERTNIKITTEDDLELARAIAKVHGV